jgi:hypothetical protein
MNQQLNALMDKRAYLERKRLQTALQNIRTVVQAAGQFTGSRRILNSMAAGANTITAYCDGAVCDYEKVVNALETRHKPNRLHVLQEQFTERLREERRAIDEILEKEVGAVAKHLDPKGLMLYAQISEAFVHAFEDAKARAEIHNNMVLQSAPSLTDILKSKWQNNKLAVASTVLVTLLLGVAAKGKDVLEFIEKLGPLIK